MTRSPPPDPLPFTTGQKIFLLLIGFIAFYLSLLFFGQLFLKFAPDFLYALGVPIIKGSPVLEYFVYFPSFLVFLLFLFLALKRIPFPLFGFLLALASTPIFLVAFLFFRLGHLHFG